MIELRWLRRRGASPVLQFREFEPLLHNHPFAPGKREAGHYRCARCGEAAALHAHAFEASRMASSCAVCGEHPTHVSHVSGVWRDVLLVDE